MRNCPRCYSTNIKRTTDAYTCSACGFIKKQLNVVVEDNFTSNFNFKKSMSFITERTMKSSRLKAAVESDIQEKWKKYVKAFQSVFKRSLTSYKNILREDEQQFVNINKKIWFRYLQKSKQIGLSMAQLFQQKSHQQVLVQQSQVQNDQVEQINSSQQIINEYFNIFSNQVESEGQIVQNQEQDQQKQEKAQKQSIQENKATIQKIKHLAKINLVGTIKKKMFFKLLNQFTHWQTKVLRYTAKIYSYHLCNKVKQKTLRQNIMDIKHGNRYISLKWLKKQAEKRYQIKQLNKKSLVQFIFYYDLLYHKISGYRQRAFKLIDLYNMRNKFKTSPLIQISHKHFMYLTKNNVELYPNKKQKIPLININLIYSIINLSLLLCRKTYYINQIIAITKIEFEQDDLILNQVIELFCIPKIEVIRKNSENLLKYLDLKTPFSNIQEWISRILKQLDLQSLKAEIQLLRKQLIYNSNRFIRQDIDSICVFIIYLKLKIGLDNQCLLANLDWAKLQTKYQIKHDQLYNKVSQAIKYIKQQKQHVGVSLTSIINKLNSLNKNFQYQNLSNINTQNLKTILQKFKYEIQNSLNLSKYVKQSLQSFQKCLEFDQIQKQVQEYVVMINGKINNNRKYVQFKRNLINQVPNNIQRLKDMRIILASNNYEMIYRYKSVYNIIQKSELFLLLQLMSKNRCQIDQLWWRTEELQRQLVKFEID